MKILSIIPAKLDSKRLEKKNIQLINKKTLVEHSIDYARATEYENKIGLTHNKKFITESEEVVLDFPYKDCVLLGGQKSDDKTESYFELEKNKKKRNFF